MVQEFFPFALSVQAQSNYATVRGSILDPQRRPIPGAKIHIVLVETGAKRDVVSNDSGLYQIAGLVPGAYTLSVDHNNFKQAIQAVTLEVGQQATIDLQLQIGSNTDPTFSTPNFCASPDAVQEFQIETGSCSAEMGGAGGGQINIVTRTGSSHFHGTAYEFLRNGAMDARSFNEMDGMNFLVQNNFGASIGGPIKFVKKTYFFSNYEALRLVQNMVMVDT